MSTVREFMWAWGHAVNAHRQGWGIQQDSTMTPAAGADYLGVSNLLMVLPPSREEARAVAEFRRVIWQQKFKPNFEFKENLETIWTLAQSHPNIEGIIIDDLTSVEILERGMQPGHLEALRNALNRKTLPFDLWGVLYSMNFDLPQLADYLRLLDVISFWTWKSNDLAQLDTNFAHCRKLAQGKPIMLGLYMYDFGQKQVMPVERMKFQCEKALTWLKNGQIAGMIFLATCNTDLNLKAVEWTRQWIQEVGDETL